MVDASMVQDVANIVVTYPLSNFSSYFEAIFGLNLAYGLIQQVHNSGLNYFQSVKSNTFANWKSAHCEPSGENGGFHMGKEYDRVFHDWNKEESGYVKFSNNTVAVSRWWANISALIALTILLVTGYSPDLEIEKYKLLVVIVVTTMPTIFVFSFLKLYWRRNKRRLEKKIAVQDKIFKGAERILKDNKK